MRGVFLITLKEFTLFRILVHLLDSDWSINQIAVLPELRSLVEEKIQILQDVLQDLARQCIFLAGFLQDSC